MLDITFLGTSGGPIEGATCAILVKPSVISYDTILNESLQDELLCIDAGSGIYLLSEIIYNEQESSQPYSRYKNLYPESMEVDQYIDPNLLLTPFKDLRQSSPFKLAHKIFENMNHYLITHPHLDHISALAINSAGFKPNNSQKKVIGSSNTVNSLQDYIFNGIIWPNMPSFNIIKLITMDYWVKSQVGPNYEITMFNLLHGKIKNNLCSTVINERKSDTDSPRTPASRSGSPSVSVGDQTYESSAFLITYKSGSTSILVFGDFESDIISKTTKNFQIWHRIAPLINSKSLSAIILECSSCLTLSHIELYGHLMPLHLIKELDSLALECRRINPTSTKPLEGFNIIVNHVKESADGQFDPRRKIQEDLERLNREYDLGVKFSIALGGVTIRI